jgi:hypothetical protein
MTSYLENIEEKNFLDLKDNYDFQVDLVKFFSGGRYKMSRAEIEEQGYENLTRKFAEHMRFQSWNDATALKDLNYVNNKKLPQGGKESFGNLVQAWDNSEAAGTGAWSGLGDFSEALVKSPSTYLGMGSFGLAKAGAKAATKTTQILVRKKLKDYFSKRVVAKGMATGAVTEGAIGGVTSYGAGEVREELLNQEYTTSDLIKDIAINAAFGAVGGGVGAKITEKKAINVEELLTKQKELNKKNSLEASKKANQKITSTKQEYKRFAINKTLDMEATLAARAGDKVAGVIKDPLDPEKVSMGQSILNSMQNPEANDVFSSGLDLTTMRSITAATIEIAEKLDLKDNERITTAVANSINSKTLDVTKLIPEIRDKYNLTKEQFSLIYLADLSAAGKKLAEASKISKAVSKVEAAAPSEVMGDLTKLSNRGLSTINDIQAAEISANVIKNSAGRSKSIVAVDLFRDLDQMRIAFMTSQPATTARNVTSTGLLAAVEISDEFYRGLYRTITGKEGGGIGNTVRNMSSTLRGLSMDSATAQVVRGMLQEEMPEAYARTFHDTLRSEVSGQSQTAFAKAGRFVNIFNTATDTVFKEAAFFSSLDRQLRTAGNETVGTNVKDFILKTGKLDKLDKSMVDKALDDANRFTMQRTYMDDKSLFGKGARVASSVNKKIPFLMSGALGVPFPRYVANHIEMIADYTPGLGELAKRFENSSSSDAAFSFTGDPYKSVEDRRVRQFTGAGLIALGYYLASTKEGEINYKSIENSIKGEADIASSLGFIIAPVFIGDSLYRKWNGLAMPENIIKESLSVAGGLNDMGFDLSGIKEVIDSFVEVSITEGLSKMGGNILSTFTYPLTPLRDLQGQFSYESAGAPYTRSLASSLEEDKTEETSGMFAAQATRFLPDYDFIQYTQSFTRNEGNDIDYYSPFNPMPVGKMNPIAKTFTGVAGSPTLTGIQREMNKLNLEEYKLYRNSTVKNNNLDYVVRYRLSQIMHKNFEAWRKEKLPLGSESENKTYDEIESVELKKEIFKGFIDRQVKHQIKKTEDWFGSLIGQRNNMKARGYIRNNYFLKIAEQGDRIFNKAASDLTGEKFKTSKEYLEDSESTEEELERRQSLIEAVGKLETKLPKFQQTP